MQPLAAWMPFPPDFLRQFVTAFEGMGAEGFSRSNALGGGAMNTS